MTVIENKYLDVTSAPGGRENVTHKEIHICNLALSADLLVSAAPALANRQAGSE